MKIIAVLLCSILIFGASNAQDDKDKTTTSTTTTPPTTTSTSTTTAPITTSTSSITSTTAGPTTTPLPPVPENHKWFVNETNHTCIIVQMTVTLNIAVNITTSNSTIKKEILIPVNQTSVTTNCSEGNEQSMKLSWKSTEKANSLNNSIVMYFKKSEKSFAFDHFTVEIAPEEFPQANRSIKLEHLLPHYNTSFGCSYRVSKKQEFNLTNPDKLASGYLDVVDLQFQAFRKDSTPYFAEVCDFETPDVVPIAVGCVLAGLVVIVLAAYLINRKRSQARGFLHLSL